MSHDTGTVTPSRAVTFRALQSLTLRAQGTRTCHIVKERSALSLGYSVRFVWCRLNPVRESDPEALHYVVLLGCILVLTIRACQHPLEPYFLSNLVVQVW